VLLNSTGSKKNRAGQLLLTGRVARFTHVALCRGLITFVHADENGVEHIIVDELLSGYDGQWRAIRHKTIEKIGREDSMRVLKTADYFLEMPYVDAHRKFLPGAELVGEIFCSQLIKNAYSALGVELLPGADKLYPADFQDLPEAEPTTSRDVTDEHLIGQDILRSRPDVRARAVEMCNVARRTRESVLEADKMHLLSEMLLDSMKDIPEADAAQFAANLVVFGQLERSHDHVAGPQNAAAHARYPRADPFRVLVHQHAGLTVTGATGAYHEEPNRGSRSTPVASVTAGSSRPIR